MVCGSVENNMQIGVKANDSLFSVVIRTRVVVKSNATSLSHMGCVESASPLQTHKNVLVLLLTPVVSEIWTFDGRF